MQTLGTCVDYVASKPSKYKKMIERDALENLKLLLAAVVSFRTGSITPILKEELKYSIQCRRLSEGKDELFIEFEQLQTRKQPLRPDELEKQRRRKEQNKRAAKKFRKKRKMEEQKLKETLKTLTERSMELKKEIRQLENEKKVLESLVFSMFRQRNITCQDGMRTPEESAIGRRIICSS